MTIQNVLQQLDRLHFLTSSEKSDVASAATETAFMQKITAIFESRVEQYISTCTTAIRRTCIIEKIATPPSAYVLDEVMRAAHSVFFEQNEVSSVVSIKELLRSSQKDLLTSLALTTTAPDGSDTQALAKKTFVGYASRYRMFQMIDVNDLRALCQQLEEGKQHLFPEFLLTALQIEQTLSQFIKSAKTGIPKNQHDQLQKGILSANKDHLEDAARGILFYLQNFISAESIRQDLKTKYFNHLETSNTRLEFAQLISRGYTQTLLSDTPKTYFADDSSQACTAAKIYQICVPALSLIGFSCSVDDSIFEQQVSAIQQALAVNQQSSADIARQTEEAKAQARAAIDAWRRSIPERPFTIAVQLNGLRL